MQTESHLPSILPRVALRLALVVAIQLAVVAVLLVSLPRALAVLADCLLETPTRALTFQIESNGLARADMARVLAATLGEEAAPPPLNGAWALLATRDEGQDVFLTNWPREWPAPLANQLRDWLRGRAATEAPTWFTLRQDDSLYTVGAAPRAGGEGWVVVLGDDTQSLALWAAGQAGALSFAVRSAAEAAETARPPTLGDVLNGSLEANAVVPGLVGEATVVSFSVSTQGVAFILRAFGIILGASVLLIAGVQALTFVSTYVQVMQPVKRILEALEGYAETGDWAPPLMQFREPQAMVEVMTHAVEAQKQAEAQALDLVSQLRAFLDALPAAAAIKGADLRLRMINSELARLAGKEPEEVLGKTDLEIYPEQAARLYTYHDRQVLESGETLQFEEALETADGVRRTYRTVKAPIRDGDGQVTGLVSLSVDITREREMQARLMEAQKSQLMGRLAGGVAHIFNNLLTAVIGSAELALMSLNEDHAAREELHQVKEAADRGARVSRQLLYLGRRQRSGDGPSSVESVTTDLLPVLREMGGPGVDVETRFSPGLPEVLIDSGELRQVLMHLVLNSIEAMTEGGTVLIESLPVTPPAAALLVEPNLGEAPCVLVRVKDSGPGIASELLDHLFEPFYTTKGTAGGRGLGLPVVNSIVRNHQGAVLFRSEPGEGAVFEVYLPSLAANERQQESRPVASKGGASGSEVILLAEDEPSVRELTERMLASKGYTLWSAGRGDEALRLIQDRGVPPDLVLTDVLMPGMSGVELALAVRCLYPDVPILLMSGYVGESDDDDLKGFPLLWKPFTMESLTQSVRGLLDKDGR